jgi:hypothetical protein
MKNSALWVVLAVLVLAGAAWYLTRPYDFAAFDFGKGPCPGKRVKFKVGDPQMAEFVAEGAEVDVIMNYYACNTPKPGDVVLYRFSREHRPVVKQIAAAPGDEFEVINDAKLKRWTLKVNGRHFEWNGAPYYFGVPSATPPLKLSEVQMKGKLPSDATIVLSGHPPGIYDSAMYGAISVADVIGKVDLPNARASEPVASTSPKTETEK